MYLYLELCLVSCAAFLMKITYNPISIPMTDWGPPSKTN